MVQIYSQYAKMTKEKAQNAIFILERFKALLDIDSDIHLATYLNVKPNTISSWRKRNSLDYSLIIAKCEEKKLDLNYVFLNKTSTLTELDSEIKETNKENKALEIALLNRTTIEDLKCQIEAFKTLLKIDEQLRD